MWWTVWVVEVHRRKEAGPTCQGGNPRPQTWTFRGTQYQSRPQGPWSKNHNAPASVGINSGVSTPRSDKRRVIAAMSKFTSGRKIGERDWITAIGGSPTCQVPLINPPSNGEHFWSRKRDQCRRGSFFVMKREYPLTLCVVVSTFASNHWSAAWVTSRLFFWWLA